MVGAMVGSVAFANALIKYMTIGINIAHECFSPTLWANPFASACQLILIFLCHRNLVLCSRCSSVQGLNNLNTMNG